MRLSQPTPPELPDVVAAIDTALQELDSRKEAWRRTSIDDRLKLLDTLRVNTDREAQRWVDAAVEAKGIPKGSPLAGEEWMSGPLSLLIAVDHLGRTLRALRDGKDVLQGSPVRTRPDGQVVVRVFPADRFESLLMNGIRSDIWMQPGVTPDSLRSTMAVAYRGEPPEATVSVVLGAGNVSSIAPLDLLYKLIVEGQVAIVKTNPVNGYLGPVFKDIFRAFEDSGFVRWTCGGADVGAYLTTHPLVAEIHVTGSERTHDAIVFGAGAEGRARKERNEPLNDRPITSELGGVGPTIVVPGPWTPADIAFQAEHVATQKVHNGGFNCIAVQVLVLPEIWDKSDTFLGAVRDTIAARRPRVAYYPGAAERVTAVLKAHRNADVLNEGPSARVLVSGLDASDDSEYCFNTEVFGAALAETRLPGEDAGSFLRHAVVFANDKLRGTLGAQILIHPATLEDLGAMFEDLLAELRYGNIGVNAWSGVGYQLARAPWGAFPGHARNDIQSGHGVVHNALMFDKSERQIVYAPFRPFPRSWVHGELTLLPRPPWFVTHRTAAEVARRMTRFSANPGWRHIPGLFASALRG